MIGSPVPLMLVTSRMRMPLILAISLFISAIASEAPGWLANIIPMPALAPAVFICSVRACMSKPWESLVYMRTSKSSTSCISGGSGAIQRSVVVT